MKLPLQNSLEFKWWVVHGHEIESSKLSIKIMRDLKYDKKTIEKVRVLIENHMNKNQFASDRASKRLLARVGEENIYSLF